MECLTRLVGLRSICQDSGDEPLFYLDDAEGIDQIALSQLAKPTDVSGKAFAFSIIEAAARFMVADIETIIPKGYTIKGTLNAFCNSCTYTALSNSSDNTGITVTNSMKTDYGYLSIDSLKIKINSTGTFTILIDDGILPKSISTDFVSGKEKVITNINYKTTEKSVKIYFSESGISLVALNCPTTKGCGCSGRSKSSSDITVKGLVNGSDSTIQYGFIPCASVVCSIDGILCDIVNQQPRLFALALFYRSVSRYFSEFNVTTRNNVNASFKDDQKVAIADHYLALYYERLRGSKDVKGISDNMKAVLDNIKDSCIDCKRPVGVAWATT